MPRLTANTGPAKRAGVVDNIRIKYNGDALLAGKNEMDNPIFVRFDRFGELEDWTLDSPPEESGYGIYISGPGHELMSRQDNILFDTPHYNQNHPLIDGDPLVDAARRSVVAPFTQPPLLELVDTGQTGFPEGWWAITYAYGQGDIGSGLLTQVAPVTAVFLSEGEGARIPLGGTSPEGISHVAFGMAGPFDNEIAALGANQVWEQKSVPVKPKLPAIVDILGPYQHTKPLSFTQNTTKVPAQPAPGTPGTAEANVQGEAGGDPNDGGGLVEGVDLVPKVNMPVAVGAQAGEGTGGTPKYTGETPKYTGP